MPGIRKEDIKINAYDSQVEVITADNAQRKYHKNVELPEEADIETARSTYNNGILEVTFDKKKKEIKERRKKENKGNKRVRWREKKKKKKKKKGNERKKRKEIWKDKIEK